MEKGNTLIYIIIAVVIVVALFMFFNHSVNKVGDQTIDVKTNTKIAATSVNVGTFYDGQNGYSVSIPVAIAQLVFGLMLMVTPLYLIQKQPKQERPQKNILYIFPTQQLIGKFPA
jgi:uncharacterized membrane protein